MGKRLLRELREFARMAGWHGVGETVKIMERLRVKRRVTGQSIPVTGLTFETEFRAMKLWRDPQQPFLESGTLPKLLLSECLSEWSMIYYESHAG